MERELSFLQFIFFTFLEEAFTMTEKSYFTAAVKVENLADLLSKILKVMGERTTFVLFYKLIIEIPKFGLYIKSNGTYGFGKFSKHKKGIDNFIKDLRRIVQTFDKRGSVSLEWRWELWWTCNSMPRKNGSLFYDEEQEKLTIYPDSCHVDSISKKVPELTLHQC
jgi:hypothetical protein